MTIEQWIVVAIFLATIIGLIIYQKKPERIFAFAGLVCLTTGSVSTAELLENSINQGVLTLLLLIVCSFALERTNYLRKLSTHLFKREGLSSYLKLFFTTAFASAIFNNTAVVASLINPINNNKIIAPSKLLIPLSYIAILAGTLTLIGTSTNLIVNSLLIEKGHSGFTFFQLFPVGFLALISCSILILFLLPMLKSKGKRQEEVANYFVEAKVIKNSALVGRSIEKNALRHLDDLYLAEIVRNELIITPVIPSEIIQADDKLIFCGDIKKVNQLKQLNGVELFADKTGLINDDLTEVMIKPNASIIGKTLKSSGFRARFDAAVIAIRREGHKVSGKLGDIVLESGDLLVLSVGHDFSSRTNLTKNFFLLSELAIETSLTGWKQRFVLFGFVGAIVTSLLFDIALFSCFLFYLAGLVTLNCLSINEIKRRFPLEIWCVVTCALTLATALDNVGVTNVIANIAESTLLQYSPYVALVGVFLFTVLLTETMTNNAAATLVFPIAYSISVGLGVSYLPFVMAVAFGASGSFISPYGYQTNLMVFNAGNYKFIDFVKFGLPVSAVYSTVVLIMLPIVFPF